LGFISGLQLAGSASLRSQTARVGGWRQNSKHEE
jgi:hypothetical protein